MAAQPQPPPQPIYPHDLNLAFDRLYVRVTGYVETRISHFSERIETQMRIDKQESILRDQDAIRRDNELANAILALREEGRSFREEMRIFREESQKQTQAILQFIRDNHAEAMGGINELRRDVNVLRRDVDELRQKGSE